MAEPPAYPGMPPWVKVSGIIVIVIALLGTVALLTGHGGPWRHLPGRHADGHAPSASVTEGGAQP